MGYAAAELEPLYLRLRELILGSGKIAVDETKAPVLDPGRGRVKNGYFWAIARDDRPWGGTDPPAIAFTYAPGRGAVHALKLLDGYCGVLKCDGYSAYKKLAAEAPGEAVTLAFCWSRLRRRLYDHAKSGNAPIASEALERIAALYAIEKTIRGASAEERRRVRQERSKPLVAAIKTWLERQLARVSAKATIAEDIRYGLNHWDGLVRFLDDGRIELDTNIVERGIRPIVLNRKNALFAGHDEGAANWACIASLIEMLQAQRRRSASLFRPRARQVRQPLARFPPRRGHALGLGRRAPDRRTGKGRCVTIDPIGVGSNFMASSPSAPKTTAPSPELGDFPEP